MNDDKESGGVQSAEVVLHLLRTLAEGGGNMALSRLAAIAGMPAAKAHRYVVSLARAGFVEQTGRHGNYELGAQALRLGLVALGRLDVMELATATIGDLRDETDQTVMLAIWGDYGPVVVRWIESSHPVTVNVRIGSVMPILNSATGRVFGAWMAWDLIEPLLRTAAGGVAGGWNKAAASAAKAMLEKIREEGASIVTGAMLPGIQAIGAPVFNAQGQLEAAITVLGSIGSFDISKNGTVAAALQRAVRTLSDRLGHGASKNRLSRPA